MENIPAGKAPRLSSLRHSLPDLTPYRKFECLPEREMLLPTGEGKLLPRCRSSIDRLQGLDLSIEFSTLFSKLSKSNLKGNRKSNAGLGRKDAPSVLLPVQHLQALAGPKRWQKEGKEAVQGNFPPAQPRASSTGTASPDPGNGSSPPHQHAISAGSNGYVFFCFGVKQTDPWPLC